MLVEINATMQATKLQEVNCLTEEQLTNFDQRYDDLIAQDLAANLPPQPVKPPPKKRSRPKQSPELSGSVAEPQSGGAGLYMRF